MAFVAFQLLLRLIFGLTIYQQLLMTTNRDSHCQEWVRT